jgi:hypothetical protein
MAQPPTDNIDLDRPSPARIYDYLLGGSHHFAVDRHTAQQIIVAAPAAVPAARANRGFLARAVRYAVDAAGITQLLDLGCGILTAGAVHAIARQANRSARTVYVDIDPIAVHHALNLLDSDPQTTALHADLRDVDHIVTHPATTRLIDVAEPVAVLLTAVLHFVPGDLAATMAALRGHLAPGSLLVISHAATPLTDPACQQRAETVTGLYAATGSGLHLRTPAEIAALVAGLDLLPPADGHPTRLVPVDAWRPEADTPADPAIAALLAGVARQP